MSGRTGGAGGAGPDAADDVVGRELVVDVGPVAHGGHCVARVAGPQGRVLFVRHALPGERVRVRVTEGAEGDRFWRADAVEVLSASPDRVEAACPWAGPGRCGGCDFQHVEIGAQRALKAAVVAEQLSRLAGLDREVTVEEVPWPPAADAAPGASPDERAGGLRWRTRVSFAVDGAGRAGLRAHRSHRVVAVDDCRIASRGVGDVAATAQRWARAAAVEVVAPAAAREALVVVDPAPAAPGGQRAAAPKLPALPGAASLAVRTASGLERRRGRTWVAEDVDLPAGRRSFRVTGAGFWQVHPGAPAALVAAVLEALRPVPGERAIDLYSGVGLFAAALADAVGPDGRVVAVEADERAAADARRNLREAGQVAIVNGRVEAVLRRGAAEGSRAEGEDLARADLVVLDPPRSGARRAVVRAVAALRPRAVAYVACDPAALARDLATFAELGYVLDGLRAFDLFPQTHHVECVARLVPGGADAADAPGGADGARAALDRP